MVGERSLGGYFGEWMSGWVCLHGWGGVSLGGAKGGRTVGTSGGGIRVQGHGNVRVLIGFVKGRRDVQTGDMGGAGPGTWVRGAGIGRRECTIPHCRTVFEACGCTKDCVELSRMLGWAILSACGGGLGRGGGGGRGRRVRGWGLRIPRCFGRGGCLGRGLRRGLGRGRGC